MAALTRRRVVLGGAIVGVVGLVATVIGFVLDVERALLGYLAAYVTVASIAIGALVLLLVGYAANARWLAAVRRLQAALVLVFPVLVVLFIPIAIGVEALYPWAGAGEGLAEPERVIVDAKRAYLNPAGVIVRSALYLAVFVIAAEVLHGWSRRRAAVPPGDDPEHVLRRERVFAAAMLPPVGLALTFASFDWLMSLQPAWLSSMFGVYFFAAGFSAGIAALAVLAASVRARLALTGHHFHALGRMLFGFAVFWAYTSYFQGFLIQIANRPIEVTFFVERTRHGWQLMLWAIVLARFALPFFLLLSRARKHRPWFVASVAVIVLVGHALDMVWLVVPSAGAGLSWSELAALLAVAGPCVVFAAWRMRGVPLVPTSDPFHAAALRYESPT